MVDVTDPKRALATRTAFDAAAPTYAARTSANLVLEGFRDQLRQTVAGLVAPPASLLDAGCGAGLDAEHFARLGYRVMGIDASAGMVAASGTRAARFGGKLTVRQVALEDVRALDAPPFDLIYSDLGPLNCVENLSAVLAALGSHLQPGGAIVISVMARVCPWEWLLFAPTGRWRRLAVRLRSRAVPVRLGDGLVWTRYYTEGDLRRAAAGAGLQVHSVRALGLAVPPPYSSLAHRAALIRRLQGLDDAIAGLPLLRGLGDHLLAVMKKPA